MNEMKKQLRFNANGKIRMIILIDLILNLILSSCRMKQMNL